MVAVVVFEFSVMRCQPLRRALGIQRRLRHALWIEKRRWTEGIC